MLLYTMWVMGSSWQSAMANVIWDDLTHAERFNVFVSMFVNWSTVMVAFLDKTISHVATGQNPLSDEDKKQIAKETTATV